MKKNNENSKNKSNNIEEHKNNLDMLLDNNSESYQIMKNQKPKIDSKGKKVLINFEEKKESEDIELTKKTLKRSNSIKLYKKHKKEKEENINENNDNTKNIKNNENLFKGPERKKSENAKKVKFLEPNFLTIIDVESYKKFNAENTCKDPFEDLEFLNSINNVNNYNINININNKKNDDVEKEKVNCSCTCSAF